MTVVKPLEYIVQFYSSKDLKKWDFMSEFGKQGDTTKIWECPSLVKVPVENSKDSKWVLMISSGHRQAAYLAMQYFVGDFDGKSFKPQKQNEIFYLDEGKDFYAAIPFYNLPKTQKNPIIIGWTNDWEYANDIPAGEGYRGGFSVARKFSLYTTDGVIKLKQEPIINSKVKTETLALTKNYVLNSSLGKKTQNSYRLILDIDLTSSKGFDLQLLKYENQYLLLSYDVSTKIFSVDRTKSGKVDFNKRFSSVETTKILPKNNKLLLDILVDKSIMEVYINGGKVVFTELTFPDNHSTSEVFSFF